MAKEKAKREIAEQEIRGRQLSDSCELFRSLKAQIAEVEEANQAAEEVTKLNQSVLGDD